MKRDRCSPIKVTRVVWLISILMWNIPFILSGSIKAMKEPVSDEYEIRLAQAKAMALVVENMMRHELQPTYNSIEAASCLQKEYGIDDNLVFTSKCAFREVDRIYDHLNMTQNLTILEAIQHNMSDIWRECLNPKGMPNYTRSKDSDFGKLLSRMDFSILKHLIQEIPTIVEGGSSPTVFIVQLGNGQDAWKLLNTSVEQDWLVLLRQKPTMIRVTAVSSKLVYPPVTSPLFQIDTSMIRTTLKSDKDNIQVSHFSFNESVSSASAFVSWFSATNSSLECKYQVLLYDKKEEIEMKKWSGVANSSLEIGNLDFEQGYSVTVVETCEDGKEKRLERKFDTPSCLELTWFDFELCPPPPPTNVRLHKSNDNYFKIAWGIPHYVSQCNPVLHYDLAVHHHKVPSITTFSYTLQDNEYFHPGKYNYMSIANGTVPGHVTMVDVNNVTQIWGKFYVSITAVGPAGPSTPSVHVAVYEGGEDTFELEARHTVLVIVGSVMLLSSFAVCLFGNYFKQKDP